MVAKRIIPCLDIDKGRVVKGTAFVNLIDAGDPVACARDYNQQGADELTVLDISASHENRTTTLQIIERIASEVFIPLTVGGGVRSTDDIRQLLNAGADKVSINTAAVHNPELVTDAAKIFGSQCIVLAIDALTIKANNWQVVTHGGRTETQLDVIKWAKTMTNPTNQCTANCGAGEILLTSMDKDGAKSGFDLALTRAVSDAVNVPVIASGGVGELHHLADGITKGHAEAVLAASIFHYGKYTVAQVKDYLAKQSIEIRL